MEKKLRVYLDTSVFGGCFDEEFREDSQRLIEALRFGRMTLLLSEVVLAELRRAPFEVRRMPDTIPGYFKELVSLSRAAFELQTAYIKAGIVGEKSKTDALHVAVASTARADAIISWNFKHIVRLDKIKEYNYVNYQYGYGILTILSPWEVSPDEG